MTARLEDDRLLRGAGHFVDDVNRPGQLWMRVVRSQAAHAHIASVRTEKAVRLPGVHVALTGLDLAQVPRIPVRTKVNDLELEPFLQPVLARDRVRYVGEPVAVLLAEDPYVAEDAAELIETDYEPLPVVLDAVEAIRPGAPMLRDGLTNEAACLVCGYGDVAGAFERASDVVRAELKVGRHTGMPLETRGLLAEHDAGADRLEVWGATKVPHFNRGVLADMLGMPAERIHMRRSDAGGGFGIRGELYPEDFLVCFLARSTGHPVKWIEDRAEHLVAANHSREQLHRIEAAFDGEHRLLAIRVEVWHDNGAYLRTHGLIVPDLTASMLPGPYRVPAYEAIVHVALTNKTPCGTYRGPGRFEGTFVRERVLDIAAARLGVERVELRRRNLMEASDLPHRRELSVIGTEMLLDEGDYLGLFDLALEAAGFVGWEEEAERLRRQGHLVGTGVGCFLEKSGLGPHETASVEVDTRIGAVRVAVGSTSLGQGVETAFARIAARELGVSPTDVEVIAGDTDLVPDGVGSWASRTTVVGGSAVLLASRDVANQARSSAADGLFAIRTFETTHMTYPYGVHLAQVEVDPETGDSHVLRYFIAYEVGRAIDRRLVEGQLAGGAAQGMGGALMEEFRYDESGNPLAVTFADYLLPTVTETPSVEILVCEDWPSASNPLGAKGAGEGGASGCGAAIASAIDDALGMPGAITALPASPERVRALLRERAGGAP